ncbi:diacylglycerol kinase (ATP) [Actinoplanes lutulentus]|uniref:Diacylglycerol kinase n=1 Tax=Actinoplanes lutulentus TaxID=1287878 RepID=A0A327ZKJ0_9ACTN|nr:diacylglycerol kinase family protein [Actinoplanes lutulentus]MBB2943996.1 diacylglycerol kinase (ATP) [Actinoplanes lutulentus]RAK42771.1 diacylglycerol kinase [Actinoplanes lutulentus]
MTSSFIAVLANPSAGRGRHRGLLPGVVDALGVSGRPVRILDAGTGAEAELACHRAVADGAAAVVAVGGDGTVHRALQAVAGTEVPFGVVPAGTGNDFASAVGVPMAGLEAAEAIGLALREERAHRCDLARTRDAQGEQRWFCAVLAAGFDALVNERANRMRRPRGPRRYDLAIVLELARLRARDYVITLDGVEHRFRGEIVAVGNCASYGGGMRIAPDADPTDGLLDVIFASRLGRLGVAQLKPRLRHGTHISDARVTVLRGREVRLATAGIIGYADGERIGALPLDITCVPGALRLLR